MTVSDSNLGQMFQEALAHHQAGHLAEAERRYRQILAQQPQHAEAWHLLGALAAQVGQREVAVELIRRALAIEPNYPTALSNLGKILRDMGRYDEAIAACRQAIALDPNFAEAYSKLGVALRDQGRLEEAVVAFRQAIALEPKDPEPYCNLGVALKDQGRLEEAIAAYRQALALNPNMVEAYHNLGNELREVGQLDEAIAAYRQALALRPDCVADHSNLVYTLHFHPGYEAEAIAEEHRRWNRQFAEPLQKFIQPHGNNRDPERRLRIGYVSPDFGHHPVGRFLLPLLTHHNKHEVEVFAYSQVRRPDEMTPRFVACADKWRSIVDLSDVQVAELIRADQIDILVDLTMHLANNRLLVFARKPAPVQATWLAYAGTTGLSAIDYRLSDPYLDPPGRDETVYSEQTVRLPETYWCYQPVDGLPEVGALPALEKGFVTFGCLNSFYKVNDGVLRVWARLLRKVPQSRLRLFAREASHRRRVQEVMAQEGVEIARVLFADWMPLLDYYRLYNTIDIGLDTFPYGGGTTTCDAMWMGVTTVSLAGRTAVGRGGVSILSNVGLAELVAGTEADYCRFAAELAADLQRLGQLRSTLRERMKASPLMDGPRFARNMEAAYRQMWRRWCATVGGR
jgi:predicted O-linked N-acetylglucosamine transferase (SPINDLY family)